MSRIRDFVGESRIWKKFERSRLGNLAIRHRKISLLILMLIFLSYPSFKYIGFFEPTLSIEKKPRVVVLLLDGAVGDIVYDMAEAGELPNIKEHLYDRGLVVENAQTVFPTVTGTAHIPILTGRDIHEHNIPGLRWFNRRELIYRDYVGPGAAYINFEMGDVEMFGELFPDKKVFFVFEAINRGVHELYPLDVEVIPMKTGWHELADRAAVEGAMTRFIPGRKPPDITLVWFPGPDKAIHHFGPSSQGYRDTLINSDKQIGRFINRLRSIGIYEDTTLILVSDHGGYDTGSHDVLADFFKDKGFEVLNLGTPQSFLPDIPYLAIPMNYPKEIADIANWSISPSFEVVVAVTGNGMAFIYVKDLVDGWAKKPDYIELREYGPGEIDFVEELLGRESVDLVFAKDSDTYYIFSRNGISKFDKKNEFGDLMFRYEILEGEDPIGYSEEARTMSLIEDWVSAENWFETTFDFQYPNIFYHVYSVFESDRTGDLIATSKDGWSFRREVPEAFHGDHGPPTRSNIVVPLIVAGPRFDHEFLEKGRTTDVVSYIAVALEDR